MVKKRSKKTLYSRYNGPRLKPLNRKQAKLKAKNETKNRPKLPSAYSLTKQSVLTMFKFRQPLIGIVIIYLLLNAFLASGIGNINSDIDSIKAELNNSAPITHPVANGVFGFLQLTASSGVTGSGAGSVFQAALLIVISLAIIWSLRQLMAGNKINLKQSFYSSMAPLIPFLLIIGVMVIQLLPITLGSAVVSSVVASLGSVSVFWTVFFAIILGSLLAWSLYMLSATILAMYIVTLPNWEPIKSLRSARNLVRFRRWLILRKILVLPILVVGAMYLVILPLILYATFLVTPVFYIMGVLGLLFTHTYLYSLYRSLLE